MNLEGILGLIGIFSFALAAFVVALRNGGLKERVAVLKGEISERGAIHIFAVNTLRTALQQEEKDNSILLGEIEGLNDMLQECDMPDAVYNRLDRLLWNQDRNKTGVGTNTEGLLADETFFVAEDETEESDGI